MHKLTSLRPLLNMTVDMTAGDTISDCTQYGGHRSLCLTISRIFLIIYIYIYIINVSLVYLTPLHIYSYTLHYHTLFISLSTSLSLYLSLSLMRECTISMSSSITLYLTLSSSLTPIPISSSLPIFNSPSIILFIFKNCIFIF